MDLVSAEPIGGEVDALQGRGSGEVAVIGGWKSGWEATSVGGDHSAGGPLGPDSSDWQRRTPKRNRPGGGRHGHPGPTRRPGQRQGQRQG